MHVFDPEEYAFVRSVVRTPLRPIEPDDYILDFESELRRYLRDDEDDALGTRCDDDVDPSLLIARASWSSVNWRAAVNDGESPFDVMDAKSQDMLKVYETIVRPGTKPEDEQFIFDMLGNILYFESFDVSEGFDGRMVVRHFVDHLLRFHDDGSGAVYIYGGNEAPFVRDGVKDCGFDLVRRSGNVEYYALDLSRRRPPPADRTNVRSIRRPPVREE